jgi:cardiolipin synthase
MFPAMLGAIGAAGKSVDLETYIFAPGPLGLRFVAALTKAVQRGVRVRVTGCALGLRVGVQEFFSFLFLFLSTTCRPL